MRRGDITAIIVCFGLVLPQVVQASSLARQMEDANGIFWKGDYPAAAAAYAELENLGVHSCELFYNRATAEARTGRLGVAVQYYEKALRVSPGEEDAFHNLQVIRDFIARRASEQGRDTAVAPSAGPIRALLDRFSANGAALAFLLFMTLAFGVLTLRMFIRVDFPRTVLGVAAGVLFTMTLLTGLVTFGKWYIYTHQKEAIVVVSGVLEVREGPSDSPVRFSLEEGSRVTLLESRGQWFRIRDDQGRDGWASLSDLGHI